jgi:hypothetical protein
MNQIPTVRVCELGKIKTSTVELGPKGKQGIPGPPGPPGSGTVFSAVASVDLKAGQAVYANGLGQLALATATIYGTTKVLGLVVAYTAITTAHDNATGNNKTKLLAVETSIQTVGLIDAAFTGA